MRNAFDYPMGSFRQLLILTAPLLISTLSGTSMLFIDRLVLAHHSTEAMNAVAASAMVYFMLSFGASTITGITEVFVGQHHGARQDHLVAAPVWQMWWLSLAFGLLCGGIGSQMGPWVIPEPLLDEGLPYFRWMMTFGFVMPMQTAVSGFFTGIGRPAIIMYVAILGNLVNLALDVLLVFGYADLIPAYGTSGAAIASIVSQWLQVVILAAVFLKPEYRQRYRSGHASWQTSVMRSCVRIGWPAAMGHVMEMGAWAGLFHLAARLSSQHVLMMSLGQSLFILFICVSEALQKGVTAVAANAIGAGWMQALNRMIRSAAILHGLVMVPIAIGLCSDVTWVMQWFDVPLDAGANTAQQLAITCRFVLGYLIIDGLIWIIAGVLIAAGDTRFVMVANAACAWLFAIGPIAWLVAIDYPLPPSMMWGGMLFYASINLICFSWRYQRGRWRAHKLTA